MPTPSELTDRELELLKALALMCGQYMEHDGVLDHMYMGAGERAVEQLVRYGLVDPGGRGGIWTAAGEAMIA